MPVFKFANEEKWDMPTWVMGLMLLGSLIQRKRRGKTQKPNDRQNKAKIAMQWKHAGKI